MFIRMAHQQGDSSLDLALQENIAFVPRRVFYDDESGDHAGKLSYSGSNAEWME